ncbi:MAG: protein translocase subunit SecD [Gemmatimonadetes bacterium]|nr:protein translocase subunit SecD [Gemmatimonadota bacterium]
MLKSIKGRLALIAVLAGLCGWYLYSNGLKLGLDLQGGMHLVLEVDDAEGTLTPEAKADAIDRALRIIRTRIDEFGVEEPLIQKVGTERIIVELAGIRDEDRAKGIIQQTAFLEWKLVHPAAELENVLPRLDRAIVAAVGPEAVRKVAVADTGRPKSIEELLFEPTRGGADTAAAAVTDTAMKAAPETRDTIAALRPLTALLNQGDSEGTFLVAEEDVDMVRGYLALPDVQRILPRDIELHWEAEPVGRGARTYRRLFVLEREPFLTGDMLENAVAGRDPQFNQAQVQFTLTRRGGRIFEDVTAQHIGDFIAIVLDGEVTSAPVVRDRIGARGQIEMGQAPMEEARDLALVLRAGALPAPLKVMEQRSVGPSLGRDSIQQGRIAGIVGLTLVLLIMMLYYRMAGVLSVLALGVYTMLLLGGLAAFNATLTVPGIAGIILSIGMAVDANVLIFERIREELAAGRATRTAVDLGFENAMSAIVDSNLTTLITALILFQFGTGPVRGFAVTLSLGIIASFFSAIFVTRTLFLIYLQRRSAAEPISI